MRWLQSFWGPEVAYFGPLDGTRSIDLEVPFLRLKLGRNSTLSFTWIQADFDMQIYFQKCCVRNHCAASIFNPFNTKAMKEFYAKLTRVFLEIFFRRFSILAYLVGLVCLKMNAFIYTNACSCSWGKDLCAFLSFMTSGVDANMQQNPNNNRLQLNTKLCVSANRIEQD